MGNTKKIVVVRESYHDLGDKLSEVIEWLEEQRESIPVEFRDGADFDLDVDEYSATVVISYRRPLTAEEEMTRDEQAARYEAAKEEQERQEFARLKAKFAPNI